ncbi:MAG: TIGR01212 family radical SAM protein [Lentisphaerae bacterium]|nr:TIGR01212 family radical SAM protein [Lentisphaerota bacterium]MCP4102412.1 TIGR01212 family radical SAM protein [Lentisphaerota bacterium]
MNKITFFKEYLVSKYGQALYRIPIDLPLGCPNRENKFGEGCVFCAEDGSRARHLRYSLDLRKQVESGISYAKRRYGAKPPYIAYFQSFTNTYGSIEELRDYYHKVLKLADFKVVMISTRPDCLQPPVLKMLAELAQEFDLWIELGVQTSNDNTLKLVNRGHDFKCTRKGVQKLAALGIKTVAHVILGLPGETNKDFTRTAQDIAQLPFSAVKLHNLLVLKKTPLARVYSKMLKAGTLKPLNEYEYAQAAADFLHLLPEEWVVMRLTADADEEAVIAPKWWMKKGQFLELFKRYFENTENQPDFYGVETADGTKTLYHPGFRQHFHTLAGAHSEADKKFIEPSKLLERLQREKTVSVLDIGFGLGYNAVAAIETAENAASGFLNVTTLEMDQRALEAAQHLFPEESLHFKVISSLLCSGSWSGKYSRIKLITGDARHSVTQLNETFDCIFMDGFSPDKNPELWSYDFIRQLTVKLSSLGIINTYSSAFTVRGAFVRLGLSVGESAAFGRKRGGTITAHNSKLIEQPLRDKDINIILHSTVGTAYRDASLKSTGKQIIKRHDKLISKLRKRGIPKWIK